MESDLLKSRVMVHLIRRRQINKVPGELPVTGIHEPKQRKRQLKSNTYCQHKSNINKTKLNMQFEINSAEPELTMAAMQGFSKTMNFKTRIYFIC